MSDEIWSKKRKHTEKFVCYGAPVTLAKYRCDSLNIRLVENDTRIVRTVQLETMKTDEDKYDTLKS